jgi:hypothetical protein
MDFHAITPLGSELLMRVVGGQVEIVPPVFCAPLADGACAVTPGALHVARRTLMEPKAPPLRMMQNWREEK